MIENILIGLLLLWLAVLAYMLWRERHRPAPAPVVLEPSSELLEELADLRHLKAQMENPPLEHAHVWERKPAIRKMGWLMYRCAYPGCLETPKSKDLHEDVENLAVLRSLMK